jgi:hypothetical protein
VAGLDRRRRTKVKIKSIAAALLMLTAASWSTAIAGDAVSSAVLRSLPNDGEYCGEKKATATFPQELRGEWCHQTDEGDCAASPGKISSGMRVELKRLTTWVDGEPDAACTVDKMYRRRDKVWQIDFKCNNPDGEKKRVRQVWTLDGARLVIPEEGSTYMRAKKGGRP